MKTWLLSVTAVCLLIILLELIISEGTTKKYISGIIRIALIITLISPIVGFVKEEYSIENFFLNTINTSVDTKNSNSKYQFDLMSKVTERKIKNKLEKNGGEVEVKVSLNNESINNVNIKVIKQSDENIYTTEIITNAVKEIVSIDKEKIIINGTE